MGRKSRRNAQTKKKVLEQPLASIVISESSETFVLGPSESSSKNEAGASDPEIMTNTEPEPEEGTTLIPGEEIKEEDEDTISLLGPGPFPPTSSTSSVLLHPPLSNPSSASFGGESCCSDSTLDEDARGTEAGVQISTSSSPVEQNDREEKRRKKKARQKEKKMAMKLALERKAATYRLHVESAHFLLETNRFDRIVDTILFSIPIFAPPENEKLVALHKSPLMTMEYFFREIPCLMTDFYKKLWSTPASKSSTDDKLFREKNKAKMPSKFRRVMITVLTFGAIFVLAILWTSCNDYSSMMCKKYISWLAYWIFLGILSSVGLGTGLHTFVLYLGPFIAKVAMAAEECSTLEFPEPPYPNQVICPLPSIPGGNRETPSILSIMSKTRYETLAWGFGTALGELPPYFVAKAARHATKKRNEKAGIIHMFQYFLQKFIMKVGFWGILLFASIPNPLFDLAGITCGHFLVPFSTFFGATVIGKSVIKSQLQMIVVILAFSEKSFASVLRFLGKIPVVGRSLRNSLAEFVDYQRAIIRDKSTSQSGGILKTTLDIFVLVLIFYFIASIVNAMARSYYKRVSSPNSAFSRRKRLEKELNKVKKRHSIN